MKVCFYTLGCKVNQQETAALRSLFLLAGYTDAAPGEAADVYVVNSCTVTAGGDRKTGQWLRRCRRENPQAVLVLTGCLPQAFPDRASAIAEADVITGSKDRGAIIEDIEAFRARGQRIVDIRPYAVADGFETLPAALPEGHTRAFVKIQDGCNRFCAYCIIPYARGRARSRDEAGILKEVAAFAADGVREVVLTGINLSCYGNETGTHLGALVEKVSALPGIDRIRLGSLEPDLLPDDVLESLSRCPKLCPQFHLALQSGCDETLRRMNRHYDTAFFTGLLAKMQKLFPGAEFTTDVIVGFPGETEAEFTRTLAYVQECNLLKVHAFRYSPRPGTAAAGFDDQIPEEVKQRRHQALQTAADARRAQVIAARVGLPQEVLLEKPLSRNLYTGYTKGYIPVAVKTIAHTTGDIVTVPLGPFDGKRCVCVEPGAKH